MLSEALIKNSHLKPKRYGQNVDVSNCGEIQTGWRKYMTYDDNRNSEKETDGVHVGRREYVKLGACAIGGAGMVASASRPASARLSRSTYTIRVGTAEETTVYVTEAADDGPTLMVTGGVHGDETNGYRSAHRIRKWDIDAGKLVVLPEACKPAIEAGTQQYEDGDLNRHFPDGTEEESPLADAIWDVVLQEDVDFLWDLHSSYGVYESGDGGVGQALFATDAGDAGVHSKAIRDYLNAEVVDDSLDDEYDFREHTHNDDGSRDMLKHKMGATLDTPAIIFETTEELSLDRQTKYTTAAVERFMYRFGLLETVSVTESSNHLSYDGDATAVNAPADDNGQRSGLLFGVTNDADREATITDIEVAPANAAVDELADHSYEEGQWTSELHVTADVQDGLTDINGGTALPATIDLSADGFSDSADREAILSAGSSATVSLYQFESGGAPVDMVGEDLTVTVEYELADGQTGSAEFALAL